MNREDRSRRKTGEAHPIDVYVGARMKHRRTELGLSQEKLGKELNLTFQQVQKYERGANRVGASRLFEMSRALNVPTEYFFDGIPADVSGDFGSEVPSDTLNDDTPKFHEGSVLTRSETLRLVTYYYRISSATQRRAVYEFVKAMGETTEDPLP